MTGSMNGIVLLAFGFSRILEETHTCNKEEEVHTQINDDLENFLIDGKCDKKVPEWVHQEGEQQQWWWGWWSTGWGLPSGKCTHWSTPPARIYLELQIFSPYQCSPWLRRCQPRNCSGWWMWWDSRRGWNKISHFLLDSFSLETLRCGIGCGNYLESITERTRAHVQHFDSIST